MIIATDLTRASFFNLSQQIWSFLLCAPSLSHVWLFVTPWTLHHPAPLSMGFSRQGCWSGFPIPSPLLTLQYLSNKCQFFSSEESSTNCHKFLPSHSSLTSVQPGCSSELSSRMSLIKVMPGRCIGKDMWTKLSLSPYVMRHQQLEHRAILPSVALFPHLSFRALQLGGFFRLVESSLLIMFACSSSSLCFHAGVPEESVFFFSPHCCFCSVTQSCI